MRMHNPPHPGRVIKEYLDDVSVTEAAQRMGVSRVTLQRIVGGTAGISDDMAYRLADLFGTSPDLWANLQKNYGMHVAAKAERPRIERITVPLAESVAAVIMSVRPKKSKSATTAA